MHRIDVDLPIKRGHMSKNHTSVCKCRTYISVIYREFSAPQLEYTLGGSSKKGSHVYILLIVDMVLLL